MIKAIRYTIKVSRGDLHFVHGMEFEIEELYFPDYKLFVNSEAFFVENDDVKIGQRLAGAKQDKEVMLDIDYEFMSKFIELIEQKKELEEKTTRRHQDLKEILFPKKDKKKE